MSRRKSVILPFDNGGTRDGACVDIDCEGVVDGVEVDVAVVGGAKGEDSVDSSIRDRFSLR